MTNLRKEFNEFKQIQEEKFIDAAEAWTEQNVIIINERLNRNAIYRLNSAIQRFDGKFGKYRDKLPAIAKILDDAENGLHLVITGKIGSRSTTQMLQRMSIMYNILSNFFGGDLGALLKTPAFRIAHDQPDEKIDKIVDRGHDIKAIRRNLASALKPNDEERIIFRRAYKSFDMPTLDWNMAAKELCCLSCNELKDLAGIQPVPMVVVDDQNQIEPGLDEAGAGDRLQTAWSNVGKAGAAATGMVAAGAVNLGGAVIDRWKGDLENMKKQLTKIASIAANIDEPEFEDIANAIKRLREKADNLGKSKFDPEAGVQGLLKHPSVIIAKQAIMAISAFQGAFTAWNKIKSNYSEGIKAEDIKNIKKELDKEIKGNVFKRMGSLFNVKPFPGLSNDEIINGFLHLAAKGVEGAEENLVKATGMKESVDRRNTKRLILELEQAINEMFLNEDFQDLQTLFSKIAPALADKTIGQSDESLTKTLKQAASGKLTGGSQPRGTQQPATEKAPATSEAGEDTNVQPPTKTEETAGKAAEISKEAETSAQQDPEIDAPDIDTLKSSVETIKKFTNNPLNIDFVNNINKIIPGYKIPGINSIDDALKFVSTYENVLTNIPNIKKAIGTTMATIEQNQKQAATPGAQALQEKRQYIVNQIKNLILEIANKQLLQQLVQKISRGQLSEPTKQLLITFANMPIEQRTGEEFQKVLQQTGVIGTNVKLGAADVIVDDYEINDIKAALGLPVSNIVQPPKPLTETVYDLVQSAQTFNDLRQSLMQHYKSVEQWNPAEDLAKRQKKSILTTIDSMIAILMNEAIAPLQKEFRSKLAQKTMKDMAHAITINLIRSGPDINGIDYSSITPKFEQFIKNFRTKNGIAEPGATTYGKRNVQKSIADAQAAFEETAKKGPVTKQAWKQQLLTMLSTNLLKEDATDDSLAKYGYTPDVIESMWNDYVSKDQKNISRLDPSETQKTSATIEVNLVEPNEEITIDSNTMNNFNRYVDIFSKSENPTIVGVKNKLVEKYKEYKLPGVNDFDSFVKFINDYSNLIQNARQIRKLFSLINKTANIIGRIPKPEEKKSEQATTATTPAASTGTGATTSSSPAPKAG
jgi:ACT domain-containing protein